MGIRAILASVAALLSAFPAYSSEPTRYRIEVDIAWSEETHPHDFFPAAHLTALIGAAHDSRYILFADGRTASSGLQSVAERGKNLILRAELEDARDRDRVGDVFEGDDLETVPGRMGASFNASEEHSSVSFVTMIAPSPDWFTGVANVPLFAGGEWLDRVEVPLWAWDAGSDSGTNWTAENAETQPRESVRLLSAPYFFDAEGLRRMGTAVLVRVKSPAETQ
jgi:hypothetical protein